MKTITARLKSISPYSQSRHYDTPKLDRELPKAYEERTWRDRLHADANGNVFIPPMAFKNALAEAAKFMSIQIPGKGKSTYTKHFEAGVLCMDPVPIGVRKDEVEGEWINANSDGVRGSGKRVKRCFPHIPTGWKGTAKFLILDETITPTVLEEHLREAGSFVGIGRFRPRNGGYYGRFVVEKVQVSEHDA